MANTTYKEEVLFNSDTLSKIVSYLPSVDLLSLALTNNIFGVSNNDKQSLIKESAHIAIQDLATEEELATLPYYNGENALADYNYLQFMRGPLTFDQLVGGVEYVHNEDKSSVFGGNNIVVNSSTFGWGTAFSNNILRAGKHYVSVTPLDSKSLIMGVMRPGQANQNASGLPFDKDFYQHFSPSIEYNNTNNVHCCMYYSSDGDCYSSDWNGSAKVEPWDGMRTRSSSGEELGMLLDLDEGKLTFYMNGLSLGVIKNGLVVHTAG